MKKYLLIVLVVSFTAFMFGCAKKEQAEEDMQAPMSMEAMSSVNTAGAPEAKTVAQKTAMTQSQVGVTASTLEPLPPAGPYKPTNKEIQLALKNAGLYMGQIDGVMGPKTKKAIEAFQQASGLKADGKVGPKTWAMLSAHLNPAPAPTKPSRR